MEDRTNTKTRILEEAFGEILAVGYKHANLVAIVQKAGVTKRGLFYCFRSKSDLVAGVLGAIEAKITSASVSGTPNDPTVTCGRVFPKWQGPSSRRWVDTALIPMRLSNEVPKNQRAVHRQIETVVGIVADKLTAAFQEAQAVEQLNRRVKPDELAVLVCAAMFGSITMYGMFQSRSPMTALRKPLTCSPYVRLMQVWVLPRNECMPARLRLTVSTLIGSARDYRTTHHSPYIRGYFRLLWLQECCKKTSQFGHNDP